MQTLLVNIKNVEALKVLQQLERSNQIEILEVDKQKQLHPAIENTLKYFGILKNMDLSDITEEQIHLQEE